MSLKSVHACALNVNASDKNGFDVHHIDYDKKNNSKKNLITLCRSCHAKTNFKRKEWQTLFENIINKKYE